MSRCVIKKKKYYFYFFFFFFFQIYIFEFSFEELWDYRVHSIIYCTFDKDETWGSNKMMKINIMALYKLWKKMSRTVTETNNKDWSNVWCNLAISVIQNHSRRK